MLVLIFKESGRTMPETKSSYLSPVMLSKTCYEEPHREKDETETLKAVIYHVELHIVMRASSSNSAQRGILRQKQKSMLFIFLLTQRDPPPLSISFFLLLHISSDFLSL